MRVCTTVAMMAALGAGFASPALADDNVPRPAFAMMDSTGDGAELVASLGAVLSNNDASIMLLQPRVLAQYFAANGLGGYATISATKTFSDTGNSSTFTLGNLELGGLYHTAVTPELDVAMRVGLAFHTATGDDQIQLIGTLAAALLRPADLAVGLPATSLRLGLSPTLHSGILFARIDAGLDRSLATESGVGSFTFGHVNLGAGVGQRHWSVTAELGLSFKLDDHDNSGALKVVGVAARYQTPEAAPYLMISRPIDALDLGDFVMITAGAAFPL